MPTHYDGTPQETLALNTFIKLSRAIDSLNNRLGQRGTNGGLSPSQFGVLEVLYHLGSMCQGQIGAKILKSSGNITMVIDNLEKHELVRRVRDVQDRRRITISLTEKGSQLISQLLPGHVAAITAEMNALSPQEQESLGALCRKLGKAETVLEAG